jgi:4-carboxymuconolactone decarboxylase
MVGGNTIYAGTSPDEIRHAILILINIIGFPTVMAWISWAEDMM